MFKFKKKVYRSLYSGMAAVIRELYVSLKL